MNDRQTGKQTWLSAISNMFQFILGFLLGVTLIAGSAAGVAFYYFKKMSSTVPEKPVYTEETTAATQTTSQTSEQETNPEATVIEEAIDESKQIATISPVEPEIPEGAYYANVTWPQGLSLRAEPSLNAARVGGVGYNAEIIVLEETADKKWQKVQVPWSKQEGWIKGGNTERTSY